MTPRARAIIRQVAAACGVSPKRIVSRERTDAVVYARMEVARRLDGFGYSSSRIGEMLCRDHTTILFYLGRGKKPPPQPRWKRPTISHLNCFCQQCSFPGETFGLVDACELTVVMAPPPPQERKRYLIPYAGAHWPEYEWKERA